MLEPKKAMLTEKDILTALDNYSPFIELSHPYSYLIDCRLNILRNDKEQWAIIVERLGFNPRGDAIRLEIESFGNCLKDQKRHNCILPIDQNNFLDTINVEVLQPDAEYWIVRGSKVKLSHNKQDYVEANIKLKEYEPNEISAEEVGRLVVTQHRNLFRATDDELYRIIPKGLKKILVLDEWYHKDHESLYEQHISDEKININYELGKHFAGEKDFMDYDAFVAQYKQKEQKIFDESLRKWQETKPSSYETWQQITKVIVTGNTSYYKPTVQPNTHWKNWTNQV